ncbi:helix-turn-helix domain-containing protein [Breznakiella homolactica]|uniref:Helix-turn-helix domain-containing protein n=1 Tax=Breznakiella homolactica TaxID=2798577 RepID=A0A7T7XQS0_9SPIR|nr:helix-turn-helix domain-containing protein [Breznakiella homolactica]QQO10766.1 XRE family transcriptional regulator [Breznakiella homolactica]
MSVGRNIQFIRKERGLTIKDVASLSGITPSLISQIENDKGNPSLNTLKALAGALKVDVVNFFGGELDRFDSPVVRANDRSVLSKNKGWNAYLLTSKNLDKFSVTYNILEIGTSTEASPELNPKGATGYEFGFVLSGKLRVELEDGVYILNEGDSICFDASKNHEVVNVANTKTEMLWALFPSQE